MSLLAIALTPDLEKRLESAARESGMPMAAYARQLLENRAPRGRRPTAGDLRAAAEASREYYGTDPEALEIADFVGA